MSAVDLVRRKPRTVCYLLAVAAVVGLAEVVDQLQIWFT